MVRISNSLYAREISLTYLPVRPEMITFFIATGVWVSVSIPMLTLEKPPLANMQNSANLPPLIFRNILLYSSLIIL